MKHKLNDQAEPIVLIEVEWIDFKLLRLKKGTRIYEKNIAIRLENPVIFGNFGRKTHENVRQMTQRKGLVMILMRVIANCGVIWYSLKSKKSNSNRTKNQNFAILFGF